MRKIILQAAVTLDGFIEGPNGEIDWCFDDGNDYGMNDFVKRIDTLFMGRKTYELTLRLGGTGFPDLSPYVFSHTLDKVQEGYRLMKGDLKKEVQEFRNTDGKDIWLFGGAALTAAFMKESLVDEIMLAVHPVILGTGKPAFGDFTGKVNLTLLNSKSYSSGLIMLHYKLASG